MPGPDSKIAILPHSLYPLRLTFLTKQQHNMPPKQNPPPPSPNLHNLLPLPLRKPVQIHTSLNVSPHHTSYQFALVSLNYEDGFICEVFYEGTWGEFLD